MIPKYLLDKGKLTLLGATTAMVLGATLAIAGSSSDRLQRKVKPKGLRPLASNNYIQGLKTHRFQVTLQTLRAWLAGPTPPVLVDVRALAPYRAGHLPRAIHRAAFDLLAGKVRLDVKGRQVVIYDQDGRFAPYLVNALRRSGVDAYTLAGGYAAWMNPHARRPGEKVKPRPTSKAADQQPARPVTPPPASAPPMAAPPPSAAPPAAAGASAKPPADEGC